MDSDVAWEHATGSEVDVLVDWIWTKIAHNSQRTRRTTEYRADHALFADIIPKHVGANIPNRLVDRY